MKIAIIGGGGQMGRWLCRRLVDEGREVIVTDKNQEKIEETRRLYGVEIAGNSAEAVGKADIIVVSVSINDFESAVREIAPSVRREQIVMDITSVKAAPVTVMHRYIETGLVLGMHPLFGPDVTSLKGQNFVVTPTNKKEKAFAERVKKYLTEHGAGVKSMSPEEHDRMMAIVQGLSHFTAIIAADALSGLGRLDEMKEVSTTTFRVFLDYIRTVIGDDPELYAAIQMEHPEMADIYITLAESMQNWAETVKRKDTQGFVERMRGLKRYIGK